MSTEIQRADLRLRRTTAAILSVGVVMALLLLYAFHRWIEQFGAGMPAAQLIAVLRRWIGVAMTASGLCLLLLAGYAARLARRSREQARWPLTDARVLRDTPVRRGESAARIAHVLNLVGMVLALLAVAAALLGWRLFTAAH